MLFFVAFVVTTPLPLTPCLSRRISQSEDGPLVTIYLSLFTVVTIYRFLPLAASLWPLAHLLFTIHSSLFTAPTFSAYPKISG